MNLQKITAIEDNKLLSCHLCCEQIPIKNAILMGWKEDISAGVNTYAYDGVWRVPSSDYSKHIYYCPDCQHFLINDLDMEE